MREKAHERSENKTKKKLVNLVVVVDTIAIKKKEGNTVEVR